MTNKVIVCNTGALAAKYGAGLNRIHVAVQALIAADSTRGIRTHYIALDDTTTMQAFGGHPVTASGDPCQNKDAIDAVFRALKPGYILILGAPDLVPHQDLANPLFHEYNDPDPIAWSDLPYACEAPYSQSARNFIGPTRVVGRLPDVTGSSDPNYLIRIINLAADYRPAHPADYGPYLGVTSPEFSGSSALTLQASFGSTSDMQTCPADGPPWPPPFFSRKSHFFNCHGYSSDPNFYSNSCDSWPIALDAASVPGNLAQGTVIATEACYGAQLYAPSTEPQRRMGMANTYLAAGCCAYFGSTTLDYGGLPDNNRADLLCQYFLDSILAGASSGRAALEARQRYARDNPSNYADDLKTLAQYVLLGDPSVIPVQSATVLQTVDARADRRNRLELAGREILRTRAVCGDRLTTPLSAALTWELSAIARRFGLENPAILTFTIENPQARSTEYHVIMSTRRLPNAPGPQVTLIEVEARGEEIVSVRRCVSH